jgi:hypothetical protein
MNEQSAVNHRVGKMADLEQQIQDAQAAVAKQGDTVRSLKASLKEGKVEKVLFRMLCST